ncbi:ABC-2 transporter permease [Ruminococcaceae bacterium OttesenSCG-928-O06]|nr:ABC-2 transporter permease [Ruminococcaceae bacterium OttesenSCG-928-O06]
MKGLVLKDFYVMQYYKKNVLIMLAMVVVLSIVMPGGYTFAPIMLMMYMMMISASLQTFDERAGWDKYAATLPCGPKAIVGARYLFYVLAMVVFMVAGFALGGILALVRGAEAGWLPELAASFAVVSGLMLLVLAISTPIAYKWGAERARVLMIVVMMVPYLAVILLLPYLEPFFTRIGDANSMLLLGVAAGVFLLLFVLSFFLSARIYAKKEF